MFRPPYPLPVEKQPNGDFVISDGYLLWRKELRVRTDSGTVVITHKRIFGRSKVEADISELVAKTAPTTEGVGQNIASGVAGVLCIRDTQIVYTKAKSIDAVLRELESLKQRLNGCLQIEDAA